MINGTTGGSASSIFEVFEGVQKSHLMDALYEAWVESGADCDIEALLADFEIGVDELFTKGCETIDCLGELIGKALEKLTPDQKTALDPLAGVSESFCEFIDKINTGLESAINFIDCLQA